MTCDDYNRLVMTRSWSELREGEAIEHTSGCARCSQLREILERAQAQLEFAMNAAQSSIHPNVLADRAMVGSRLRSVERWLLIFPILLFSLVVWLGMRGLPQSTVELLTGRRPLPAVMTSTIALRCLSAEQARELVRPYLNHNQSIVVGTIGSTQTLTLRGTAQEIEQTKKVVEQFEAHPAAACRDLQRKLKTDR